jgi:GH24 family phage-related lysozyme (muramidase)
MQPGKDCLDLVKSFEGYHRELADGNAAAYLDPVLIPTIGWGTIQYPDGKKVVMGDIRTRKQCEEYLMHEIEGKAAGVAKYVKVPLTQSMFDALVSFSYNVGLGALSESTLLRLLNAGDYEGAAAQFPRWVKAGGKTLPGLVRRRDAEQALFKKDGMQPGDTSPPKRKRITAKTGTFLKKAPVQSSELSKDEKKFVPIGVSYDIVWQSKEANSHVKVSLAYGAGNWYVFTPHWDGLTASAIPNPAGEKSEVLLATPYYSQRDNYTQGNDNWTRTCFSSSCAMLAQTVKPGCIKGDDDYISKRRKFGDSTDANAQVMCLQSLGINARFITSGDLPLVKKLLDRGIPVPCGILHKGPASAPRGGGHWVCVVGYDDKGFIVNDPWGEIRNSDGVYVSQDGEHVHYSYSLFDTRWTVASSNDGWCIVVD